MSTAICVHPDFDAIWPWAADHAQERLRGQGPVFFHRLDVGDRRPVGEVLDDPRPLRRLLSLGVPLTGDCLAALPVLREVLLPRVGDELRALLAERDIALVTHRSEGFWGQSVAEFALALTLCGLRRIPQLHRGMIAAHDVWDYHPPGDIGRPGARGQQFGDDPAFANGTLAGKRVRIVGAGNIASRYASVAHHLGAEVAAWDPYASEPCFHRSGARREHHLARLVADAEIFAPMLPLTDQTRGLVTGELIAALPRGCLVVLATRAAICDMATLRRRVLADELALAADVFDHEPLPLDDPLLGRHNVVHTPHNAGRTIDANRAYVDDLIDRSRESEEAP